MYWSHVRSAFRTSGRIAPAKKVPVVSMMSGTASAHSSLRWVSRSRLFLARSSLASGRVGTRGFRSTSFRSSRLTRDLDEQLRSSDSIRAMLKSVFLIRASLVIPDVSLNLPKKQLVIYISRIYGYAYMRAHTCRKYGSPSGDAYPSFSRHVSSLFLSLFFSFYGKSKLNA